MTDAQLWILLARVQEDLSRGLTAADDRLKELNAHASRADGVRVLAELHDLNTSLLEDLATLERAAGPRRTTDLPVLHGTGPATIGAIIPQLRREVAAGAGHECEEWRDSAGRCRLCDRVD